MNLVMRLVVAVVVVWTAAAGALPAQDGERPPGTARFEERVVVTEVLLDVVVTDRDGNPVAGLGKDDFIVKEDGRELELTSAEFYSTRYGIGAAEAIPASRYFIFFFHDVRSVSNRFNRLIQQQTEAAQQCRRWIEEEMQPSDWVAIAGHGRKLKIFQDFTQDREALARALNDAARGIDPEKARWTRKPVSDSGPSLLRELPAAEATLKKKPRDVNVSLLLVAEAAGKIAGRKTLVYLGIGFGVLEGLDVIARPNRRYYPHLERALNDNNIAVYPVDLTLPGTRHAQSSFLHGLALDTGGVYHWNFVSFITPLREIARENVGYYLLSYRSEHPEGERGYQRVKVDMREPALVVRAQRGYRYGE